MPGGCPTMLLNGSSASSVGWHKHFPPQLTELIILTGLLA